MPPVSAKLPSGQNEAELTLSVYVVMVVSCTAESGQ
jgi:hypothetical protein